MSRVIAYLAKSGLPIYGECASCGAWLVTESEGDACVCCYCLPDVPTWELPLVALRTFRRDVPPPSMIERIRARIRESLPPMRGQETNEEG